MSGLFFFFNDTATTEIYTLSLHDALPISYVLRGRHQRSPSLRISTTAPFGPGTEPRTSSRLSPGRTSTTSRDRKSTRLNSSHANISYAVFCLKKKHTLTTSPLHPHLHP